MRLFSTRLPHANEGGFILGTAASGTMLSPRCRQCHPFIRGFKELKKTHYLKLDIKPVAKAGYGLEHLIILLSINKSGIQLISAL